MRAFVPTMGALHAGHTELIRCARKMTDDVVVSIFVNPLQFDKKDDLEKYPRTPERDEKLAREAGASQIWFPTYEEIYPGHIAKESAGPIGDIFEGASRPGHFDGVLTVVKRLFEMVNPDIAFFGEKDFQQLFLIRQRFKVMKIVAVPTVRESDGLALSSRNVRLSTQGRAAAPIIARALKEASCKLSVREMKETLQKVLESEPLFTLDYATIIDAESFLEASDQSTEKRAIVAGWIDGIRLIDNAAMGER